MSIVQKIVFQKSGFGGGYFGGGLNDSRRHERNGSNRSYSAKIHFHDEI